jgi:hypothetical protein
MIFSPLAPDWKPIVWTEEERKKGQAWSRRDASGIGKSIANRRAG